MWFLNAFLGRLLPVLMVWAAMGAMPILNRAVAQDALDNQLDAEEATDTATAITVIFDCSGSMGSRNKIQQAKRAFEWWLNGLPSHYRFCLIRCEGKPKVLVPLGGTKEQVSSAVKQFRPGSGTPIVDSLKLANVEIAQRRASHSPYERHVVVLFTDGRESRHSGGIPRVRQEVLTLRDLQVEVVGIGFHGEGGYLRDVSTNYYEANDEPQLRQGLTKVDAEIDVNAQLDVSPEDVQTMLELAEHSPPGIGTDIPVGHDGESASHGESQGASHSIPIDSINQSRGSSATWSGMFFGTFLCAVFCFAVIGTAFALFVKILNTGRRV